MRLTIRLRSFRRMRAPCSSTLPAARRASMRDGKTAPGWDACSAGEDGVLMKTADNEVIGADPFHLEAPFDAAAFRKALDAAGYHRAGLAKLMRTIRPAEPIDLALLDRRTRDVGSPFAVLARLFRLGFTAQIGRAHV